MAPAISAAPPFCKSDAVLCAANCTFLLVCERGLDGFYREIVELTVDLDIYRAAQLVIDQYAEGAADYAIGRFKQLYNDHDTDGAVTWKLILEAIVELQRERGPDESVN